MKKLKITLVLAGVFCNAMLTRDQQSNLKLLEKLRLEAETCAGAEARQNILEHVGFVVKDVNEHLRISMAYASCSVYGARGIKYPEEARQILDKLSTAFRKSSADIPEINSPKFDDRLVYRGILDGLRDDLAEAMEGKRSADLEDRIYSALEVFGTISLHNITYPSAKYACSYLGALIDLIEEQLRNKGVAFDARRFARKREAIRRSIKNLCTTSDHFTTVRYVDSIGADNLIYLRDMDCVAFMLSNLLQDNFRMLPDNLRIEGELRDAILRVNDLKLERLDRFLYRVTRDRDFVMRATRHLEVGFDGGWLEAYNAAR